MPKLNDNDIIYFMILLNIVNIKHLILFNIWFFQHYLFYFIIRIIKYNRILFGY